MNIIINGQTKEVEDASSLKNVVELFCKNPSHVIAEVNGNIAKSDTWNDASIKEGDKIELVTFVGGG